MAEKLTLAEKVWNDHIVAKGENGEPDLLYIDLQLLHEVVHRSGFGTLVFDIVFVNIELRVGVCGARSAKSSRDVGGTSSRVEDVSAVCALITQ